MQKKRAEEVTSARKCFWMNLELQFQRELQLTRRARVCRGEARAGDGRKAGRNDEDRWLTNGSNIRKRDDGGSVGSEWPRLAKVWMVENIKRISAELQVESFRELCVLDQGKIHVCESRSINSVTTEVAKGPCSRQCESS